MEARIKQSYLFFLTHTLEKSNSFIQIFSDDENGGLTPKIQWKLLKWFTNPSFLDGGCILYPEEKKEIMWYIDSVNLLNQRYDLIDRCRRKNKFRLFWEKIKELITK